MYFKPDAEVLSTIHANRRHTLHWAPIIAAMASHPRRNGNSARRTSHHPRHPIWQFAEINDNEATPPTMGAREKIINHA